jgi:hypothetical protein
MHLRLVNLVGRIVFEQTFELGSNYSRTLDAEIGHPSAGMYIVQVQVGENTAEQRVVIVR